MFKKLKARIEKADFLKNVAKLATGTTIAQAISVFTAPVLYRIYDKSDYGTLGLYMAITGVIGVFSTFQYAQVILLEKNEEDAKRVMWLNRLINLLVASFILLIIIPFRGQIGNWFNNPDISRWLYLIPISLFFSGQNQIFRVWANRKKEYNILATNSIITAISVPIFSISIGLYSEGPLGLFVGLLSSHIIPPVVLVIYLSRKEKLGIEYFDFNFCKQSIISNKQFPIYGLPSEFINRLTIQLPVFMLSKFTNPGLVGIYNLCVRMLGLPIQLIGGAIGEVFKQKITESMSTTGGYKQVFLQTFKVLLGLSVIPTLVIVVFGPDLFAFVFGETWRNSGEFARILILMFALKFIVSPLSFSFILSKKLKEDFYWHCWMLLSNCVIFYLGFSLLDDYMVTITLFSINFSFIYLVYGYRSFKFSIPSNEPE